MQMAEFNRREVLDRAVWRENFPTLSAMLEEIAKSGT
jgi:hypothetical protein